MVYLRKSLHVPQGERLRGPYCNPEADQQGSGVSVKGCVEKMNIPKKIKIGGHWWEVKYPYLFKERLDHYGQCVDPQKELRISKVDGCGVERAKSSIAVTFLHELLHALDFLNSNSIFKSDNREEEERKIETLAEGIYQVLVDNKFID